MQIGEHSNLLKRARHASAQNANAE